MKPVLLPDVAITVADVDKAVAFYTKVAGFEETRRTEEYVELTNGPMRWYITEPSDPSPMFALRVASVDDTVREIVAAGGRLLAKHDSHSFVEDPNGIFMCIES